MLCRHLRRNGPVVDDDANASDKIINDKEPNGRGESGGAAAGR